ncbi:dihydrolipoyl dehydrogenase [Aquabacterium sp. CECT 9606]|uniref:dihydrolipoyl dehydrogenase n=1 Tax=Aquabacterium sp. CECT 9606 TaxID=2845822 RepID=UPI001E29C47C|nr:dihydrolipoyl dehydrogenase [Aquabacterium sp. CECT 9606]CAH0347949.1 Mercuric reductase [Aquabacterium sp. CECT 9606]
MKNLQADVAIIGFGTAGMGAYRAARDHTDRVVVIQAGPFGTTCARVGCMPSKLLIAAADSAHAIAQAPLFGVHSGPVKVDGAAVMQRVRSERDRFVGFVLDTVNDWPAEQRVLGHARFTSPHELMVDDHTLVTAQRLVIATGSSPTVPPGWREALGDRLVTNDDVFEWTTLPQSLAVVGAGVIGLELAQALSRLGVRVKLFSKGTKLGPLTDPEVSAQAFTILSAEMAVVAPAEVLTVSRQGDQAQLTYRVDGAEHTEVFEQVLVAAGRQPNLASLDLAAAGIAVNDRGMPAFDLETGQIGDSHVFIAGDAHNAHPLLHEAADDGKIAGDNAGRFPDVRVHPRRAALGVVFTDPQMMLAGASFKALKASGQEFEVGAVNFDDQGRSRVMGQNRGLLRVYGERHTGRFLGAEMMGPAAEHIGHLLSWAAQHQLTVQQMLDSPFYHPVVEEGVRTALRELNRHLRMGPRPVARCLDCGPGA